MDISIIFAIAILIMSIVLHEVSHGFTAFLLGDPTARLAGRLTLNPIKHLDLFGSVLVPLLLALLPGGFIIGWAKPVPYNPHMLRGGKYGPAMVAGAGPAMNLVIAAFFAFLIRSSLAMNLGGTPVVLLAGSIVMINVALAVFNLIPVAPFDGSKILYVFLPRSMRQIETFFESNQWWLIIIVILAIGPILGPMTNFVAKLLLWH